MVHQLNTRSSYTIIGVMSGSSLDGLDAVLCTIKLLPEPTYVILDAHTFSFTDEEVALLKKISRQATRTEASTDSWFAQVSAHYISQFIARHPDTRIDCIASHGHTTVHLPLMGITQQIGDPQVMADILRRPVIGRFRQADVLAGGQGAPLVPICDRMFFGNYHACLNLGGIANISFETADGRIGFDICGANQILNFFARQAGWDYDAEGEMAAAGLPDENALAELNAVPYLLMPWPKSLDNHFVHRAFIEPLQKHALPVNDAMATAAHHIAQQIARIIVQHKDKNNITDYRLLITGGGAFNSTLVQLIAHYANIQIQLPSAAVIQFKEALAMALMGVLRIEQKPNFLPSVTGAREAVCGGEIALPAK